MNANCPNFSNKQVKKEFDELVDVFGEDTAYFLWDKNEGYSLDKAPNGAVSELFNLLVDHYQGDRILALKTKANALTSHFMELYGDWTNGDTEPAMSTLINTNNNKDIIDRDLFMHDVAMLREEALKAVREGISVAEFNDLHKTNFGYKDGRVTINFNPMLNGNHLDIDLSQDKKVFSDTRNRITHKEFVGMLLKKFGLQYKELTADEYRKINTDPSSNCCVIGNTVYVKSNNNITNEQLAEEFLHPAIKKIHATNKHLFSNLLSLAKKDFPGLWRLIQELYGAHIGTQDNVNSMREEELVAHVLSKYYHREITDNGFNSRKMINAIHMFVQKIKTMFTDMFGSFNKALGSVKLSGSDITDLYDNITFDKLAQSFNIEDTYFTDELDGQEIMDNKDTEPIYAGDPKVLIEDTKDSFRLLVEELKHRVDQPLSAIEAADSLYLNIQNLDELSAADKILDYIGILIEKANTDTVDKGVLLNATQLVLLKTDFLGTYGGVLSKMYQYAIITDNNELKDRVNDIKRNMASIEAYYKELLERYASTYVDNYIQQHVKQGNIENFKRVAKDWLLRQEMYGDIASIERWGGMFENSRNPILRIAYNMITRANRHAMSATLNKSTDLVKAYKKAFNTVERSIPGSRLLVFLERDANGRFTGNFISKVNNGLYQQLKSDFIKDLKLKYVKEYGATIDSKGVLHFKDDEQSVWDEDGNWVKPTRYKFADEVTKWEDGKSHRLFTTKYYLEKHTKPYREYVKNGRKVVENGHGLSPLTETREREIQQLITNLENMCIEDGYFAPWKLSGKNRRKLLRLRLDKENLSSMFYEDGSPKAGDDLTVAQELTAWSNYIKGKIPYKTDKDLYKADYLKLVGLFGEKSPEVAQFLRYNSRFGINSDFINALMEKFGGKHNSTDELNMANSVLQQYKKMLMRSTDASSIDFTSVEGNPDFWDLVREAEHEIKIAKQNLKEEPIERDKEFFNYVSFKDVPHYENGVALSISEIDWLYDYTMALYTNDEQYNELREAHGINEHSMYVELAKQDWLQHELQSGIPAEMVGDVPLNFIRQQYYERQYYKIVNGKYGPLSIFKYMAPNHKNATLDGINYLTYDWNPSGKYKSVDMSKPSQFVDTKYNQLIGGEQADNRKYDNTKAYNKAVDTPEKELFLNLLTETMKEARNAIPYINDNNNKDIQKAPLVYASTMANLSRTRLSDVFKKIGYFWSRLSKVDDNTLYINNTEVVTRPDGSVVHNIPIRFLRCEHPEAISSDLVSSVSMFYNMAMNFKEKAAIENDLLILLNTLELRNELLNNSKNSASALENLIQGNLYGNLSMLRKPHARDKKNYNMDRRLVKYINGARRYSSFRMLAWNSTSAIVGALSSSTIIARDAYVGKYITGKDLWKANVTFGKYIAPMIMNMGDLIAHNKLTAMMLHMLLSKLNNEIFKTSRSKLLRFIGEHWAMGGYTIGDYCNNAIQLLAYSNNMRLYDGDEIEKGFYTKGQMIDLLVRKGHTYKEAKSIYNSTRYSAYDAYGYKDNKVYVKPEFSQYLKDDEDTDLFSRVRSRTALANGLMEGQEASAINTNIFGQFLVSMRKFAIQFLYAAWAGGNDYIPVEVEKNINGKYIHKEITEELKREKGYYDFETGENTRGYVRQSVYGVLHHGIPAMWDLIRSLNHDKELDKKGMTLDEEYATRTLVFTVGSILVATAIAGVLKVLVDGMTPLDDDIPFANLMTNLNGLSVEDALMTEYNRLLKEPLDMREEKAKQVYLRLLYLSYIREVNENLTTIDPRTYSDFITSATTFLSTSNKFEAAAADVALGMANPDYYDKLVNNGPYKGWNTWKRDVVRLTPLDNMITNHTDRGLKSKTKFYYNLNQVLFEMAGMNLPAPDKSIPSEKDPFGGDNFGSDNFGGDNFGSDNFN